MKSRLRENHIRHNQKLPVQWLLSNMTIGNNLIYSNAALSAPKDQKGNQAEETMNALVPTTMTPLICITLQNGGGKKGIDPTKSFINPQPQTIQLGHNHQTSSLIAPQSRDGSQSDTRHYLNLQPRTIHPVNPPRPQITAAKKKVPLQRNQMNRLSFYGSWRR